MSAFRTRICAVRFKSGGHLQLLQSQREIQHNKLAIALRNVVEHYLANQYDRQLAGFALVVWNADGESNAAIRNARTSPMNSTQIPTFVADRLRRSLSEDDAEGVVRDIFQLPEPSP